MSDFDFENTRLDVFAIDVETTGIDPEKDALLEVSLYGEEQWLCYDALVDYAGIIPNTAKAVHHIQEGDCLKYGVPREDVAIELVDHLAHAKPEHRVIVAHNAAFDRAFLPELKDEVWICTMRLARKLMPEAESHGLQFLRYELNTNPNPEGAPHRALYDAICCYHVMKALYALSVDQDLDVFSSRTRLAEWCWEPILLHDMKFGKHQGLTFREIARVDRGYLQWMLREEAKNPGSWDEDLLYTIKYYLN